MAALLLLIEVPRTGVTTFGHLPTNPPVLLLIEVPRTGVTYYQRGPAFGYDVTFD